MHWNWFENGHHKNLTYSLHIFTTESTSGHHFWDTGIVRPVDPSCDCRAWPKKLMGWEVSQSDGPVPAGLACHQPLKTWESEPVSHAAQSLALMSFQRSLFYTSRTFCKILFWSLTILHSCVTKIFFAQFWCEKIAQFVHLLHSAKWQVANLLAEQALSWSCAFCCQSLQKRKRFDEER